MSANLSDRTSRKPVSKRVPRILILMAIYDVALLLLYMIFKPGLALFDDKFVSENGLFHYVDFRPGYPPLGKLPYTFLYLLFKNNPIPLILYNIFVLNSMLYILFKIISEATSVHKARTLTLIAALNPTLILPTICYLHADILAITFLLLTVYAFIKGHPMQAGVYCGLGFMTKVYPAVLLIPLLFRYDSFEERLTLITAFMASTVLSSLPFLMLDPLMYVSTFIHHFLRGPSESLFALLDGYYSHTGFLHPTYEATIYAWQFAAIYSPSHYNHFRYEWQHPSLSLISSILQVGPLLLLSMIAGKRRSEFKPLEGVSLAALTYFVFSAFWNPLVAAPVFMLVLLMVLERSIVHQILIIIPLTIIDSLHHYTWFPGLPFTFEILLLTVVSLRAILFAILFLSSSTRVKE